MLYVKRDTNQNVEAVFLTPQPEAHEEAGLDSQEIQEFLSRSEKSEDNTFLSSDLDMIRVIEDLIQILLKKNLLSITDFPPSVVLKLMNRQNIREKMHGISGMNFNSTDPQ